MKNKLNLSLCRECKELCPHICLEAIEQDFDEQWNKTKPRSNLFNDVLHYANNNSEHIANLPSDLLGLANNSSQHFKNQVQYLYIHSYEKKYDIVCLPRRIIKS